MEKDTALERAETDKGIWFDVSIQSINKRLTHKHLIYIKDKNGLSNNIRMMKRGREKICF